MDDETGRAVHRRGMTPGERAGKCDSDRSQDVAALADALREVLTA